MAELSSATCYRWDKDAQQYVDARGRLVPRAEVRNALDQVMAGSDGRMAELSNRLLSGDLDLGGWQTAMMKEIKIAHLASMAAARGGWGQLTQSDLGRLGNRVKTEYAYMREFASQVRHGEVPFDGRIVARSRLYANTARRAFEEESRRSNQEAGFNEVRRRSRSAHPCSDCPRINARGWVRLDDPNPLPAPGEECECGPGCKCYFEFRRAAGPPPPPPPDDGTEPPGPAPPPPTPRVRPKPERKPKRPTPETKPAPAPERKPVVGAPILPSAPIEQRIQASEAMQRVQSTLDNLKAREADRRQLIAERDRIADEHKEIINYLNVSPDLWDLENYSLKIDHKEYDRIADEKEKRINEIRERTQKINNELSKPAIVDKLFAPVPKENRAENLKAMMLTAEDYQSPQKPMVTEALAWIKDRLVDRKDRPDLESKGLVMVYTERNARGCFFSKADAQGNDRMRLDFNGNMKTVVHEFGHMVEYRVAGVQAAAKQFVEYRCKGEAFRSMNELSETNFYEPDERGREDRFKEAFGASAGYVGKVYPWGSTEIISMGLQELHDNPVQFIERDPEYAAFILGILDGSLRLP